MSLRHGFLQIGQAVVDELDLAGIWFIGPGVTELDVVEGDQTKLVLLAEAIGFSCGTDFLVTVDTGFDTLFLWVFIPTSF